MDPLPEADSKQGRKRKPKQTIARQGQSWCDKRRARRKDESASTTKTF